MTAVVGAVAMAVTGGGVIHMHGGIDEPGGYIGNPMPISGPADHNRPSTIAERPRYGSERIHL